MTIGNPFAAGPVNCVHVWYVPVRDSVVATFTVLNVPVGPTATICFVTMRTLVSMIGRVVPKG